MVLPPCQNRLRTNFTNKAATGPTETANRTDESPRGLPALASAARLPRVRAELTRAKTRVEPQTPNPTSSHAVPHTRTSFHPGVPGRTWSTRRVPVTPRDANGTASRQGADRPTPSRTRATR